MPLWQINAGSAVRCGVVRELTRAVVALLPVANCSPHQSTTSAMALSRSAGSPSNNPRLDDLVLPLSGLSRPARRRNKVDLPAPFGPTRAIRSPRSIDSVPAGPTSLKGFAGFPVAGCA
jgi:hypothetical protein